MNCTNCGAAIETDDAFCVNCGSSLTAAPPSPPPAQLRRSKSRLLWVVVALVVVVGVIAGILWYLGIAPFQLSALAGLKRPASEPAAVMRSDAPFLVLQAYRENSLAVYATDLDGELLAQLGTSSDQGTHSQAWLQAPNTPWPQSAIPDAKGASAWVWPDGQALVALQGASGWDLISYDAERGRVWQLLQSVQQMKVLAWVSAREFLAAYEQDGSPGLLAGGVEADEVVDLGSRAGARSEVALSPDGRQATFQNDGLIVASTDGRSANRQPGAFSSLTISPDSRYLYYSTGHQLIRSDVDGRNARIIAEVGRNDRIWPMSASESYLAVQQQVGGDFDLRVMTPSGEVLSRAGRSSSAYWAHYLPSKQGLLIAVNENGQWQLDLADMKGENRRTLAQDMQDFSANPMPDNRRLVVAEERDYRWSLTLHDLQRDERQVLVQDVHRVWLLAANADRLIFAIQGDDGWSLQATNLVDGQTTELDAGASQGYPSAFFMPNGNEIIYEADEGIGVEQTALPDGQVLIEESFAGGIYRVDLQDPAPMLIRAGVNLLGASLVR